jgi:CBS domain-containing protein
MKNLQATEFMQHNPVAAHPEMSLADLVALFSREHVRALPVVEDDGRLVGVVSETDLFLKNKGVPFSLEKVPTLLGQPVEKDHLAECELATQVTVGEVMTDQPVTISSDATLERAAMLMLTHRHSVLPVVEGNRLVGMVRRIYLLRQIYGTHE